MRQMSGLAMENPIFKTAEPVAPTAEELARLERRNNWERSEDWNAGEAGQYITMPKWYRITNLVRLELPPLHRNPPAYTSHVASHKQ
jgi:hypothetical protein